MNGLLVSDIVDDDLDAIFSLANEVLEQQVFPALSKAGINTILNSLNKNTSNIFNKHVYQALKVEIEGKIVGYIAVQHGNHITQLYVDTEYQGRGIGTLLIKEIIKRTSYPLLTVRSSLNAVPFYKKIGFIPTGSESEINGISFLPMELKKTHISNP